MTKKETVRELKKLQRNILAVVKSMTVEMSKETSASTRLTILADNGILAIQFASALKFFLDSVEEVSEFSFRDAQLYRRQAQAFLTLLRATRVARAKCDVRCAGRSSRPDPPYGSHTLRPAVLQDCRPHSFRGSQGVTRHPQDLPNDPVKP